MGREHFKNELKKDDPFYVEKRKKIEFWFGLDGLDTED